MAVELCSACAADLAANEWLLVRPEGRVYPGVSCKVMWDCKSCGRMYEQWAAPDAAMVEWTDAELIELRRRVMARRSAQA
jgi:hypothetical protein